MKYIRDYNSLGRWGSYENDKDEINHVLNIARDNGYLVKTRKSNIYSDINAVIHISTEDLNSEKFIEIIRDIKDRFDNIADTCDVECFSHQLSLTRQVPKTLDDPPQDCYEVLISVNYSVPYFPAKKTKYS